MLKSEDFSFFTCNNIKIITYNFIIKYIDNKNKKFVNLLFT